MDFIFRSLDSGHCWCHSSGWQPPCFIAVFLDKVAILGGRVFEGSQTLSLFSSAEEKIYEETESGNTVIVILRLNPICLKFITSALILSYSIFLNLGLLRIAFGRVKRIFLAFAGNTKFFVCARLHKTILRYFIGNLYLHDFVLQRRYAAVEKETSTGCWLVKVSEQEIILIYFQRRL